MNKSMLEPDWTIDITEAILDTYATTDYRSWLPFSADRLTPYYYTLLVQRLSAAVSAIRSKGISINDVARQFPHLNHFRDELDALIAYWGHGELKASVDDVSNVVLFLAEVFAVLCPSDPFSRNGRFGRLSEDDVARLDANTLWEQTTLTEARELGKLIVSANTLAYALYTDVWPGAVGDIYHGPYRLANGEQLIVREYLELAPAGLWPNNGDWDAREIRILTCYRPTANLFVDFYCNLRTGSNLLQELTRCQIMIDGQVIRLAEVSSRYIHLGEVAVEQYERLRSLEFEDMKRRFMEAHCYANKCLFDIAGLEWRPRSEMYEAIRGKPLLTEIDTWRDVDEARQLYKSALAKITASNQGR